MSIRQRKWSQVAVGASLVLALAITGCGPSTGNQSDAQPTGGDAKEQAASTDEQSDVWVATKITAAYESEYQPDDGEKQTYKTKSVTTNKLDEHGNIESRETVSTNESGVTTETATNTFDEEGHILTASSTSKFEPTADVPKPDDQTHKETYTYEFDDKGRITKETCKSDNEFFSYTVEYEYDSEGNMTKSTQRSKTSSSEADGEVTYEEAIVETTYDASGHIESVTNTPVGDEADAKATKTKYEYELDDKGNPIKTTVTSGDEYTSTIETTRDENGNPTKEVTTVKTKNSTDKMTYDFEWTRVDDPSPYLRQQYRTRH